MELKGTLVFLAFDFINEKEKVVGFRCLCHVVTCKP